jgi:hypothetical protein
MKFNFKFLLAVIPLAIVGGLIYYFSEIVTYILMAWVKSSSHCHIELICHWIFTVGMDIYSPLGQSSG